VPGEAEGDAVAWPAPMEATAVLDQGRLYLRLDNTKDRPVLVQAGTVFSDGRSEVYTARDVLVPARFAVLVPAAPNPRTPAAREGALLAAGATLPAGATGALLHREGAIAPDAWSVHGGVLHFEAALRSPPVRGKTGALLARCRGLKDERGATAVGCVLLVANRPQAAHVFATHGLFLEALPDLLGGLAIRAREEELRQGDPSAAVQLARWGDPVGRSLAFVRAMLRVPAERAESYGEGFETLRMSARERALGHAVVDLRGTVVHAALYALEESWPQEAAGRREPPVPQPPTGATPETAPGVIDRKARPSIAEARQRARRK